MGWVWSLGRSVGILYHFHNPSHTLIQHPQAYLWMFFGTQPQLKPTLRRRSGTTCCSSPTENANPTFRRATEVVCWFYFEYQIIHWVKLWFNFELKETILNVIYYMQIQIFSIIYQWYFQFCCKWLFDKFVCWWHNYLHKWWQYWRSSE